MKVILKNQRGYHWVSNGSVSFKGYFQYKGKEEVYREEDALSELCPIDKIDIFVKFLQSIDGVYSIIIKKDNYVLAAVDRARSMPLYFAIDGSVISDSAEEIRKYKGIAKDAVDAEAYFELVSGYYLEGNKTVYKEISQLDLGEAIALSEGQQRIESYYHHINAVRDLTKEEIKSKLTETAYRVFERIKQAINGRPVVLSMSGGYDSRFVGCMLKNVGVTDVSCYTYGKPDNFEVSQSRKNAEALGFRWTCVEMSGEWISQQLDEVGQEYLDSYEGHDFTAYMQNFPAVRKLHEEGWFKPGSVFLTGLCGDMPTGEYVMPEDPKKKYDVNLAAETIYRSVFCRYEHKNEASRLQWIDSIKKRMQQLPIQIQDYQTYHSVVDCISTGTCHSHWFMHMNSVHGFFGYEWLLPYWDSELLDLWYSVPAKYKFKQSLYEDWLLNDICKPYGLNQKKTIVGYSDRKLIKYIQYTVGGILNYVLLHLGKPFTRPQDFNNFAYLELELYKRINSKNLINYQRAGMMQMLDHFLMERRYGVDNYNKLFVKKAKLIK